MYNPAKNLKEAEQRIRQANSADEMLNELALCGGYSFKLFEKILQKKAILEDENATCVSRLNAYSSLKKIEWERELSQTFPYGIPDIPSYMPTIARKELTYAGSNITKDVEQNINEIKNLKNSVMKIFDDAIDTTNTQEVKAYSIFKDCIMESIDSVSVSDLFIDNIFIDANEKFYKSFIKKYPHFYWNELQNNNTLSKLFEKIYNIMRASEGNLRKIRELEHECADKIKNKLFEISPITDKQAQEWVDNNITISSDVLSFLNNPYYIYKIENLKNDCAEIYKLTGGKVNREITFVAQKNTKEYTARCQADLLNGLIMLDENDTNKCSVFHEFAHFIEAESPQYGMCSKDFILSKATQKRKLKLKTLTKDDDYENEEVAYPDHFVHPYVGKWYGDDENITEVISMGVELLSSPEDLYKILEKDPEHLNYILGVCMSEEKIKRISKQEEDNDKKNSNMEKLKKIFKEKIPDLCEMLEDDYLPERYGYYNGKYFGNVIVDSYGIIYKKEKYAIARKDGYNPIEITKAISKETAIFTLYLFAIRDYIKALEHKNIKEIFDIVKNMQKGIFPEWYTGEQEFSYWKEALYRYLQQ